MNARREFTNKELFIIGYIVFVFLFYTSTMIIGFQNETLFRFLIREDGPYETLSAFFYFVSVLLFFYLFWKYPIDIKRKKSHFKRNIFYLFLSVILLFVFLEELSWGQRIFQFETPTHLRELNIQNSTNIHNLKWFHYIIHRVAIGTLMIYFVIIPLLNMLIVPFRSLLEKVAFPVPSFMVSLFFLCSVYLYYFCYSLISSRNLEYWYEVNYSEPLEFFVPIVIFIYAVETLQRERSKNLLGKSFSDKVQV